MRHSPPASRRSPPPPVTPLVALLAALTSTGCDLLFPELSNRPDASVYDGGPAGDGGPAAPALGGTACVLADVRDYRTCQHRLTGSLRVTIEETRQATMTDSSGRFSIALAQPLDHALVAVVDPQGRFYPTVVPVRLRAGVAPQLAIPLVEVQTLSDVATRAGAFLDAQRGTLLAWAVDPSGTPVAGVATNQPAALTDDQAPNQLSPGLQTRARGTIALFDLPPATLQLQLAPPATSGLRGDIFPLPIRSGALTAIALVLTR